MAAAIFASSAFAQASSVAGVWWAKAGAPRIAPIEGGEPPFTPAGLAAYRKNQAGLADKSVQDRTTRFCLPEGLPRSWGSAYPFEIIETPGQVTVVYEANHAFRLIDMTQPAPPMTDENREPWYNGHSYGRWEGDTLVVDAVDFNDRTFIDATGLPHSDRLRVTERIRRLSGGKQLEVVATVEDAEIFAKPWSARFVYESRPQIRLDTSYTCGEKHRDLSQAKGGGR